jgi:hypothetical protein
MSATTALVLPVIDRLRVTTRLPVSAAFSLGDALARGASGDQLFVYLASESAEAEREVQGNSGRHMQRVTATLAVVASIASSAAARDGAMDASEARRALVLDALAGWRIPDTERNLAYSRFVVATLERGMIWQEQQFLTRWRLTQQGSAQGVT